MAELIQKQDTLNQGREKINAAITDAETAKNISEQADDKATQALAQSESTQTQLDTIVIEGDSSVEAAQARVSSEGTAYGTLKERLDTEHADVTSQLAETATAEGDLIDLLQSYSALKDFVIVKVPDEDTIDIGVFFQEDKATIYTMKKDGDGWWRLFNVINRPMTKTEKQTEKNYESITGEWNTSTNPTHYTTEIGATFSLEFFGTGFNFNSRVNDQGGVWEFVIDNKIRKVISTYSDINEYNKVQTVVHGLKNKKHVVTATFLGDDPNNAPSDGVSRGWVNHYTLEGSHKRTIEYWQDTYQNENGIVVMQADSRKEFAFSCKPASYGGSTVWVPEHGVLGVMDIKFSQIFFGEKEVGDLSLEENVYYKYSSARFITKFKAKHPSTPEVMWEGRLDQTINGEGFHIRGRFEFQNDTYISSGYPGMLAMDSSVTKVDRVVTSTGKRYNLPLSINDNSNIVINENASSLGFFTDAQTGSQFANNTFTAIRVYDFKRFMRERLGGESSEPIVVRLRTDGHRKAYYKSFEDFVEKAGTVYDFGTSYFSGEIKDAKNILPG